MSSEFRDNAEPNNAVFCETGDQSVDVPRHEKRLHEGDVRARLFAGAGIAILLFPAQLLCHLEILPNRALVIDNSRQIDCC